MEFQGRTALAARVLVGALAVVAAVSLTSCKSDPKGGTGSQDSVAVTVGTAGASIELRSGSSVTVPPGGTSGSVQVRASESPGTGSGGFTDPTRVLRLELTGSGSPTESVTVTVSVPLARTPPADSTTGVTVQFADDPDSTRYWATSVGPAAAVNAAADDGILGVPSADQPRVSATMRFLNTAVLFVRVVGLRNVPPNQCSDIYRLAAARGTTTSATPSLNVVLVHGLQLDRYCGLSFQGNDYSGLQPFSTFEADDGWASLVSAIKTAMPTANVYVYRYPSTYHPRTNGADLAARLGQLQLGAGPLVLVGHSMGGLVARYAAASAVPAIKTLITIGTPHFGTPVADFGTYMVSPLFPSEGVRSLQEGVLTDLAWPPPVPLHAFSGAVRCNARPASSSLRATHRVLCAYYGNDGADVVLGDGIVPTTSSLPATGATTYPVPTSAVDHLQEAGNAGLISSVVGVLQRQVVQVGYTSNFLSWTGMDDPAHYYTLVRVDGQTGAVTNIGGSDYFTALAYAPNGTLYGIASDLHIINPANGSSTLIGPLLYQSQSVLMWTAAFSPAGTLYAMENASPNRVFTVNLSSGALAYVGTPAAIIEGLAFSSGGTLYAAFASLFTLSPTSLATLSTVGATPAFIGALALGGTGAMYGMDVFPSTRLYTLNLSSGQSTASIALGSIGLKPLVAERSTSTASLVEFNRIAGARGLASAPATATLLERERAIKARHDAPVGNP